MDSGVLRPVTVPVRLSEVLPPGAQVIGTDEVLVTGASLDSRAVQPGDLYAALPGHRTHGAVFARQAVAAGAVAIVTDPAGRDACAAAGIPVAVIEKPRLQLGDIAARIYGHPARALQLIGITGTNGKTTVAAMVESGLRAAGRHPGSIGTVGVEVDGRHFSGLRTTPEATEIQAVLAVMRDAGVGTAVMEVSSIALEEHRVDSLRFDVAAFTNLSQDHLDYHGSMSAYFDAKARLFTPALSDRGIVGIDDAWGRELARRAGIPVQTWSLEDPHADWHAERDRGLEVVDSDGHRHRLDPPLPGAFNVSNAVCAFAVLRAAGVGSDDAARGIASARVPGRMQEVGRTGDVTGYVDYAHSPDAIERVLLTARELTAGRVIVVLGAGGDRDRSKRPAMGRTAARLADVLVVTDDNPRSEDPAQIRAAVREGALQVESRERAQILEEADRARAVTVAVDSAEAGDVVLVLGKGHEQGQEVAGIISPFDDAAVLAGALAARSGS